MSDRGERRAQKQRHKNRVRRFIVDTWYGMRDAPFLDAMVNKVAGHGKLCSCYACGNPRRHHGGPTIQERRADSEREQP